MLASKDSLMGKQLQLCWSIAIEPRLLQKLRTVNVTIRDEKNAIRNNIVGESVSIGAVIVDHVHTEILADPSTKGLAIEKVHNTSMKMGLVPMESLMMVTRPK